MSSRPAEASVCKGSPGIFLVGRPYIHQAAHGHRIRTFGGLVRQMPCLQVKNAGTSHGSESDVFHMAKIQKYHTVF